MNHTPEPWIVDDCHIHPATGLVHTSPIYDSDVIVQAPVEIRPGSLLADVDKANLARIVACVNACAGIPDPETTIPDLIEALNVMVASFSGAMDLDEEGLDPDGFDYDCITQAKSVLAALQPRNPAAGSGDTL